MPGVGAAGVPSLSTIEGWDTEHLHSAARSWSDTADLWEDSFDQVHQGALHPGGTVWEGEAADAAADRTLRDLITVRGASDRLTEAADIARRGADRLGELKRSVLSAIGAARAAGFTVGEDLSLLDNSVLVGPELAARQALAEKYAAEIHYRAAALSLMDHEVAANISAALAPLAEVVFDKAPADAGSSIHGLDFKTAPSEPLPLPEDPEQFRDAWEKLSPAEKDHLYDLDHNIGNHPGMPADPADHRGKYWYNSRHLADALAEAQASADRAEALRNQHPDWSAGNHIPESDRTDYEAWQRQYESALAGAKYLPDLKSTDKALKAGPDRGLMLLDTTSGQQAHAAIAIGDPDKATHTSVTTPGLNTTVHGAVENMATEADQLRTEALRQLGITPGHETDSVSTIAWIGYDAPQVPGTDELGASASGLWDVSHDTLARAGADDLARFYDGLQAAHQGAPGDLTAIGHSYGSLTTGLALQEPGDHGVSRALFYGSPGIEASTPQELHLQPGQVFAMATPDDPIQYVYDARTIGQGLPILGTYINNEFGDFGPNPATNPNFTQLATGPMTTPDGLSLQGASGHSDYPRFPENGELRTTNFNIAAVLAGLKPIEQQ